MHASDKVFATMNRINNKQSTDKYDYAMYLV